MDADDLSNAHSQFTRAEKLEVGPHVGACRGGAHGRGRDESGIPSYIFLLARRPRGSGWHVFRARSKREQDSQPVQVGPRGGSCTQTQVAQIAPRVPAQKNVTESYPRAIRESGTTPVLGHIETATWSLATSGCVKSPIPG